MECANLKLRGVAAMLVSESENLFEDAVENRVNGMQLTIQIERIFEGVSVQKNFDARISEDALPEAGLGFPSRHGMFLHPFVSVFARGARFDKVLQKLAGKDQPSREIQIAAHALREDAHPGNNIGHARE